MLRILATALVAASIVGSAQAKTIWRDVTYEDRGNIGYGTDGSVQRLDIYEVLVAPPLHPKREHGNRVCLT